MTTVPEFAALFEQAKQQLKHRQYIQAIELFHQARDIDDDEPDLHEALATAYVLSGNVEAAISHFKRVTLLAPRKSAAFVNLGALYNRNGEFQKAVEVCRKAVSIDKKSADGYYNLGFAHRKLNQLAMAVPAYREAIRINPQMISGHQNLGNVFLEMGNAREAIAHFKRALSIDPGFTKAQVGLEKAQLMKEQGKTAFSPFGRLVDTAEVAKKQEGLEASSLRSLTEEERVEDHHMVQVIDRSIARAARDLRDQLKSKLIPEITELDRSVGSQESFHEVLAKFKPIATYFQTASRQLEAAVRELHDHQQRMLLVQRK